MEVATPSQTLGFNFSSGRSSPHIIPPRMADYYFSAPTSPSHLSQFYSIEKEITPKSPLVDFDFAFDVSTDRDTASLSAEDLFDGGVIKPLKPPTPPQQRGRERSAPLPKLPSRRAARSLSPIRDSVPQYLREEAEEENKEPRQSGKSSSSSSSSSRKLGQKKWSNSIKDFFLFRSASEGRAADKDPLKKYTAAVRRSSFRAAEDGSGSKRRGPVSAHELHYTVNRAVSEDLKRKTFLPYKQGILGRLAFNPAVHALANGFGLSRK